MENLDAASVDDARADDARAFTSPLLNRRRLLVAGATSAVGAAAASQKPIKALAFEGDERSFCIRAGDDPLWRVDASWFDGSPQLSHTIGEDRFDLSLRGALLTGTQLRCDFRLVARKSRRLWTYELEFSHLHARGKGDLQAWLDGSEPLVCAATIPASRGGTSDLALRLGGDATLVVHSDWRLDFHGEDIASVRVRDDVATCSRVTAVVARPVDASEGAADSGLLRSTQLFMEGDPLGAIVPDVAGLQARFDGGVRLVAELTRHAANVRELQALASWRSANGAGVLVAQAGGAPLPISALRVDERFGRGACRDLDAVPVGSFWVDLANVSYELGAAPDACARAHQGAEGARAMVNGVFANRFVVPFVGADVAYFEKAEGAKVENLISWQSTFVALRAIPLKDYRLVVRRTLDGFAGSFRFKGLELVPRLRGWVLEPLDGVKGDLSFELGSQHLQEEAIYSASAPGTSNVGDEVICAPVPSKEARVLAVIANVAMHSAASPPPAPSAPLKAAVLLVLQRFRADLREQFKNVKRKDLSKSGDFVFLDNYKVVNWPLPPAFFKYLTQEFGQQLVTAVKTIYGSNPAAVQVIETEAEKYKDKDDPDFFAKFEPQAVESGPSRLVFNLLFDRGASLPFSMASLLGWSVEQKTDASVRFYEALSFRAIAPDAIDKPSVAKRLRDPNPPTLQEEGVSAVELPYRLSVTLLKPVWNELTLSRWRASPSPILAWGAPNNLWHARAGNAGAGTLPMRALESPDFIKTKFFQPPPPFPNRDIAEFRASLDGHDRHNIVGLTGSFGVDALAGSGLVRAPATGENGEFVSQPFNASRLILTPQGATFDFLGEWDPPAAPSPHPGALTVSKWDHHARLRRDTEVTVEYKGFLLPLGVPAVLIKRTTREFKRAKNGTSYRAVLVQRFSIRVDPGEFSFPDYGHPFEARDWFLRKLKVDPPETPPLLPPENTEVQRLGRQAFWPAVPSGASNQTCAGGRLFEFTIKGGATEFRVPLVFVDNQVAHTPATLKRVLDEYVNEVTARKDEMNGRKPYQTNKALATLTRGEIEFLPGAGSRNSRHEVIDFVLGVALPAATPTTRDMGPANESDLAFNRERERLRKPPFYPRMSQAQASIALLARLSGNPAKRNFVAYHPLFVEKGFDPELNKGQVFLRFVDKGAELGFGGDTTKSGGPFAATTQMMAIAREHGPIGGASHESVVRLKSSRFKTLAAGNADSVAKFMQGLSDPVEYFGQKMGDAKIAGCVRMVDVVKTALAVSGTQVPKLNQQEVFDDLVELLRPVLLDASGGPAKVLGSLADSLESAGLPASALEKLRTPLNAARNALASARAALGVSPTDAAAVGAAVSDAYSNLKQFLDDARALAENPVALLPPEVARVFDTAKQMLRDLQLLRTALDDLPRLLWSEAMSALSAEVARIEAQLVAQPEFRGLHDAVTAARATLLALERAAMGSALDRAGAILGELLQPMLAVQRWGQLAVDGVTNAALGQVLGVVQRALIVEGQIDDIRKAVNDTVNELASSGTGAVRQLNDQLSRAVDETERREIEDALQSAVQLREALIAYAAVAEQRVRLATATPLEVVRIARFYLEAYDVLMRSGAELHRHLAKLNVQSSFEELLFNVLLQTGLAKQLQDLERDLLPLLGDARDQVEQAFNAARGFVEALEGANAADFEALLKDLHQTVMEELSVRLNAVASALLPQAAELVSRVKEMEQRLDAVVVLIAAPLDTLRPLLAPIENFDVTPVKDYLSEDFTARLNAIKAQMTAFRTAWPAGQARTRKSANNAFRAASAAAAMFQGISSLVGYIGDMIGGGNLGGLVNLRGLGEKVLEAIGVPSKLRISYDWRCDISEFPRGGAAVFRPAPGRGSGRGGSAQLMIASRNEVSLRGEGASGSVTGKLDAFSLHLFGSAPFLILDFQPITFQAGSNQPMKFDVKLENVRFGQALKFVNELAALLNADSGFYVQLLQGRPGVEVGYRFNKDIIQLAAMTLQNVSFSVAVLLPFDNSATRFKVAVGTRQKPILASVGIYGGGFFAALTMRADTMELIEAMFEYGGVTGCEFGGGLARGTCKIVAGVYIALGVRDEITGYFCASGALTIASIFRAGGELMVSLTRARGSMAGLATYSFSFSIGLVDYSYSVSVSYTKDGGGNMTESADNQGSQQQPVTTSDAIARLGAARRDLDAERDDPKTAYRGGGSAPTTADHVADFKEKAATPGKLDPGLAESSAWRAYVGAFADLDEGLN